MSRKRLSVEQIIGKLRQADVELGQGKTVEEACRVLAITVQTYWRWRQEYGGMQPAMARQFLADDESVDREEFTELGVGPTQIFPSKPI